MSFDPLSSPLVDAFARSIRDDDRPVAPKPADDMTNAGNASVGGGVSLDKHEQDGRNLHSPRAISDR
jgi:hypothetical protein